MLVGREEEAQDPYCSWALGAKQTLLESSKEVRLDRSGGAWMLGHKPRLAQVRDMIKEDKVGHASAPPAL